MVDRACGGASARAGCGAAGRGGAMGAAAELLAAAMRGTRRHAEGTSGRGSMRRTRQGAHLREMTTARRRPTAAGFERRRRELGELELGFCAAQSGS